MGNMAPRAVPAVSLPLPGTLAASDAMGRGWCLHGSGDPAAPTGPLLTQLAPSSLLRFISLEYLQSSAQRNAKLLLHCSGLRCYITLDQWLSPL